MSYQATLAYRADLQGLRAVAVTLVVLSHAGLPGLPGGFVGVDIFFVLSGYLITGLLVREYQVSGHIDLLAFVARRLRRLLPALLSMLTLVMLLGSVLLSGHEFSEQTASVAYAASWTSNLFFTFTTFDYFADLHLRDLFLHTWSLGVEEQYYLLWPALSLLVLALARRHLVRWDSRHVLLAGIAMLFAGSLALSLYWSFSRPLWAFYLMPSRVWQFALGAAVFVWFEARTKHRVPAMRRSGTLRWHALALTGLGLIVGSAIGLNPHLVYPGAWALLPSAGTAMLIAAGERRTTHGIPAMLSRPTLVWIGDHSYSWYLWHWPLLMLGFAWGLEGNPSATAALVLLSLLVAMVSYRRIELPIWKGRLSDATALRSIGISGLGIALAAVALGHMNVALRDSEALGAQLARSARQDMPDIYRMHCDTWYKSASVQPCVIGAADAKHTAVLLGDSIGAQWYSLLPALFDMEQWRLVVLTKSACAMVDQDYQYAAAGGTYTVCTQWRNQALDEVARMAPDVVFVGSTSSYAFSEAQWHAGMQRVLRRLTAAAGQTFVIPGTPILSFDGPACLERWLTRHADRGDPPHSACREPLAGKQALRVAGYLRQVVALFENATFLDLNDLVCPDGYCAARNAQGQVVYRDRKHLTDSFVRAQVPLVRNRLRQTGRSVLLADRR
ncbi:MAG: acyltransferase [Chromatiaceae bacterium]|nr:acyltransferase [Chromatiaceae bacterium]